MKKANLLLVIVLLLWMGCISTPGKINKDRGLSFDNYHTTVQNIELTELTGNDIENIIFLIGDGMGFNQIAYTKELANVERFAMEKIPYLGKMGTNSLGSAVTDSAASGTALACGIKTYNRSIGVDGDDNEVPSIADFCEEVGMATGVVVTATVTHATPAAFIASNKDRDNERQIAADISDEEFDIILGGGWDYWSPALLDKMKQKGYSLPRNKDELAQITEGNVLGMFSDKALTTYDENEPSLLEMTNKALEILNKNENGFFLMVEGSQIDTYCHKNDLEFARQLTEFDLAVESALQFAMQDGKTMVVVTADHETGGIIKSEKGFFFTSTAHTKAKVPVFIYAPEQIGQEFANNVKENTDFYSFFRSLLE